MRLVPRFSLRFALLALTIFLIVFGVGVKYWREYQEHTASVERLLNAGWAVEEEPVTLFGYTVGKKLTGLVAEIEIKPETAQAFLEISRLQDLRRLCIVDYLQRFQQLEAFLDKLQQAPELERLQLGYLNLSDQQLQRLGDFMRLRILDLRRVDFTAESLAFLEHLPQLEILDLYGNCALEDITRLNLPRLKFLKTSGDFSDELRLTREDWGRFPQLETLEVDQKFTKVVCEPGAMPALKHLVLTSQDKQTQIDWPQLVAAVQQLEALAVVAPHVNEEMFAQLKSLKQLRLFCIAEGRATEVSHLYYERMELTQHGAKIKIPKTLLRPLIYFMSDFPQVDLAKDELNFRSRIYPTD